MSEARPTFDMKNAVKVGDKIDFVIHLNSVLHNKGACRLHLPALNALLHNT
jgi:hypothetical protein